MGVSANEVLDEGKLTLIRSTEGGKKLGCSFAQLPVCEPYSSHGIRLGCARHRGQKIENFG